MKDLFIVAAMVAILLAIIVPCCMQRETTEKVEAIQKVWIANNQHGMQYAVCMIVPDATGMTLRRIDARKVNVKIGQRREALVTTRNNGVTVDLTVTTVTEVGHE